MYYLEDDYESARGRRGEKGQKEASPRPEVRPARAWHKRGAMNFSVTVFLLASANLCERLPCALQETQGAADNHVSDDNMVAM